MVKKKDDTVDSATTNEDVSVAEIKDTSSEKRLQELEKKLSEMGDTINAQNEFIQGASVVINTLAYTPELREAFQSQLKKQYGMVGEGEGTGQQQEKEPPKTNNIADVAGKDEDVTRKVNEVVVSQRENIIDQFEKEHGIAKLTKDEQKEERRKIESYLNEFGWSVRNIPLQNLKSNLEKAYLGSNIEKFKEEGKLEGIAQFRTNEQGAVGTFSSEETGFNEVKQDLTKGQKEWAEKLGVDVDSAKKTYFAKDEEYKRKVKAEEEAQKQ